MNLSTSTSDNGWRQLLRLYALWTLGIGFVVGSFLLALDPYDTGHFALFGSHGIPAFGQRLAVASLGRQAEYNAAIFGNSTMQLIDPSQITGGDLRAVSLTIPGTGPREQLAAAKWFIEHHPGGKARALIFGIDGRWCEENRPLELTHPFPFWLYGASKTSYAINMMQFQTLESAIRKIKLLVGAAQPMPSNGYNDYTEGRTWDRAGFRDRLGSVNEETEPEAVETQSYDFQSAQMLTEFFGKLPADTSVILVMPPHYQPETDGKSVAQRKACKATFKAIVEGRANTQLLDFLPRKDLTSVDKDYFDRMHYRGRVARIMEGEIGSALAGQQ